MKIGERIESDIKEAMKARAAEKLSYLRNFKSALKYKEIDKKEKLTEGEEIEVLSSAVKKLRDALEMAKQGGREDHVGKIQAEIDLALSYLPEQMGEAELEKITLEVIRSLGAESPADMGRVMKELMPRVKGKSDGNAVKGVVTRLLKG